MAIVIKVLPPLLPTLCFSAPTVLREALVAEGYTLQVERLPPGQKLHKNVICKTIVVKI